MNATLTVENLRGIEEAEIVLNFDINKLIFLQGPNGSGKSTILSAINLLVSDDKISRDNIMIGKDSAKITLEIESNNTNYKFVRTIPREGTIKLEGYESGIKISSPSKTIKMLIDPISTNLSALMEMSDKELINHLLSAANISIDLNTLHQNNIEASKYDILESIDETLLRLKKLKFDERTKVNKELKERKTILKDKTDAVKKIESKYSKIDPNGKSNIREKIEEYKNTIHSLKTKVKDEVDRLNDEKQQTIRKIERAYDEKIKSIYDNNTTEEEIDKIKQEISQLEMYQTEVEYYNTLCSEITNIDNNVQELNERSDKLSVNLQNIDMFMRSICDQIVSNIEGLSFTEDMSALTYENTPISTLNMAKKIEVYSKIAATLVGENGILILDNLEHLDAKSIKKFVKILKSYNINVIAGYATNQKILESIIGDDNNIEINNP